MGVIPTRMMPMGGWRPSAPPLPYDAEVEYLESTGTQYIDTGVAPGDNELDFSLVAKNLSTGGYAAFFGCRDDISGGVYVPSNYSAFVRANNNGEMRADIGNSGAAIALPLRNVADYSVAWDSATRTLTVSNIESGTTSTATASTKSASAFSFALFGINTAGTFAAGAHARIYSATFTKGGVLVRDFVPVRVGSGSSAVGHLFDRVSGALFGNAGTGAFTIGPDKT